MAAVQPVPDDEIAAELAASWDGDDVDDLPRRLAEVPARRRPTDSPVRRRPTDPADLREAAELVRPVSLAHEQVLPLAPAFAGLLPGGLPRSSTVVVAGSGVAVPSGAGAGGTAGPSGATSLGLALVAAASAAGSWVALVGLPAMGLAAAADAGLALERLVVIEPPPAEHWGTVVGALVGAFDVVLVGMPRDGRVRPAELRRLVARSRERGSVLVQLVGPVAGGSWSRGPRAGEGLEADLRLAVGTVRWEGLGSGHGHLRRRRAVVEVTGRRAAARIRRVELWLPDAEGRVRAVADPSVLGTVSGSRDPEPCPEQAWADAG